MSSRPANVIDFTPGESRELVERCYYEQAGNRFWVRGEAGERGIRYEPKSERQLVRWLKSHGLRSGLTKEELQAGIVMAPIEEAVFEIEHQRAVDLAGPFAGWHAGPQMNSGRRILVTESPRLIDPLPPAEDAPALEDGTCKGWPLIGEFLKTRLHGPDVVDQRPYHFGWLQRSVRSLRAGTPLRGHAVLFAGDVDCGKSLWIAVLQAIFGGRVARPLKYIFGESNFNSELFFAPLLLIDDEGAKTQIADRKLLAARVKQMVAVSGASCEGKGKDAIELHTFMRPVFATNLEEQNLLVFPPIDNDLADKVQLFKMHGGEWPWAHLLEGVSSEQREAVIWQALSAEIPYFLYWLEHEFELPADYYADRFGVKEWHHPEILEGIDFLSPEARLWSWIERTVLRSQNHYESKALPLGEWQGTAGDLEATLRDPEVGLGWKERDKVPPANPTIGRYLTKLAERPSHARAISLKRQAGTGKRVWRLLSQEAAEAQPAEAVQGEIF